MRRLSWLSRLGSRRDPARWDWNLRFPIGCHAFSNLFWNWFGSPGCMLRPFSTALQLAPLAVGTPLTLFLDRLPAWIRAHPPRPREPRPTAPPLRTPNSPGPAG